MPNRRPKNNLPDLSFEEQAHREGYTLIAGLDEVGRGSLAGPVVSSAVIFPRGVRVPEVNDSKKLSASKREFLFLAITAAATDIGVGLADSEEVDRLNILNATRLSMERAIAAMTVSPDFLLIDAVTLKRIALPQRAIVKGDTLSHAIAAASIIAKVTRDRMMADYHDLFPQYNLLSNKGYGTVEHRSCIRRFGPTRIHRQSFLKKIFQQDVE